MLLGLVLVLAVAAGLVFVRTGGGTSAAQAQAPIDIVQVTPERGDHPQPALVQSSMPGTSTTSTLITVYHSDPREMEHGLYTKKSTDGGNTWSPPMAVALGPAYDPDLARAPNGTVWLVYIRWTETGANIYAQTTTPDGMNWSGEHLIADADPNLHEPTVTVTNTGRVIVASRWCCPWNLDYTYSDDGGMTWQGPFHLTDPKMTTDVSSLDLAAKLGPTTSSAWIVWHGRSQVDVAPGEYQWRWGIWLQSSHDNGMTWSMPMLLQERGHQPSLAKIQGGLALSWTDEYQQCFGDPLGYCNSDIWYRTRDASGWSPMTKYTGYHGNDHQSSVTGLRGGGFALAWQSQRRRLQSAWNMNSTVWFGNPAVHQDLNPPPAVVRLENFPVPNPQTGEEVKILARVASDGTTTVPILHWRIDDAPQPAMPMLDRGDGVFAAPLGPFDRPRTNVEYNVEVEDVHGNRMFSFRRGFEVQPQVPKRSNVLLVVDDTREHVAEDVGPFYGRAFREAGIGFDFWNTSRLGPLTLHDLRPYRDGIVVWSTPEYESWLWRYWPDRERPRRDIAAHLDHGGSLFITGQHISEHFRHEDPRWLARYLGAANVSCCAPDQVVGVAGDPIGDGLTFGLSGGDGANNSGGPDEIRAVGDAVPVFTYHPSAAAAPKPAASQQFSAEDYERSLAQSSSPVPSSQRQAPEPATHLTEATAAVRYSRGQSKVVYAAFNFESINAAAMRTEVMSRIMAWANPTCNGRASTIDGTFGPDTISGTPHDDVIVAFGGPNIVFARGGNDTVCGGPDQDIIHGGAGDDWIGGGGGDDRLNGAMGRDRIFGHAGADLILGGMDDDLINAGPGHDQVAAGAGDDVVFGSLGNDLLLGGPGDDMLMGGPGDDTIKCGFGSDIADGGADTDTANAMCELQASIP